MNATPAQRLESARKSKEQVHAEFAKIDRALAEGKLSVEEYRYYIAKTHGGKQEHEILRELEEQEERIRGLIEKRRGGIRGVPMALALLISVGLLSVLIFGPQEIPTGLLLFGPHSEAVQTEEAYFNESTLLPLNITNTTLLKVSGAAAGEVRVALIRDNISFVVYEHRDPERVLRTENWSNALGSNITFALDPPEPHTLWLTSPDGKKIPVENSSIVLNDPGNYSADALVNTSGNVTIVSTWLLIREDNDSTANVPRNYMESFTEACEETCTLKPSNASLFLNITIKDGTLKLDNIFYSVARDNLPPESIGEIPDFKVKSGETISINLSSHFIDPDGDALNYDFMTAPGVNMVVTGDQLQITGMKEGKVSSLVYASDLYGLVQSNAFTITVLAADPRTSASTINGTIQESTAPQEENKTSNQNETIVVSRSENKTLDCSNTDPNQRPLGCVQLAAERHTPEPIYLEDLDRRVAAKLTPIGNLLIRGNLLEGSSGKPGNRDFRVAVSDGFGGSSAMAWIDSDGNLHLRGSLYEEELELLPPRGAYSLQNSHSVTVAYFDRRTGDLHLRGNLISGRGELG